MIDSTYEDKLYQTPTFAGAFRYNTLKNCATRVCRACLDEITCVAVIYLTLRICLGMGAHCAPLQKKKSSAVPHISERSHIGNLRQAIHGKGVILKRVETAGVYPLVRPRGVSAVPFASQAKSPQKRKSQKIKKF